MEDWPEYKDLTVPNSCVMDQITQQGALLSARIGIEVAPVSIHEYEIWADAIKVLPLPLSDLLQGHRVAFILQLLLV